jgi:hypothetical protein
MARRAMRQRVRPADISLQELMEKLREAGLSEDAIQDGSGGAREPRALAERTARGGRI